MQAEIEILQVEKKIRTRVKKQMEKTQKEYYLNEQMQAIQKELRRARRVQERDPGARGEAQDQEDEQGGAGAKVKKELKKLKMMHPMSAEATVVRNYIDWILALPWDDKTEEKLDINEAEKILDEDHYGLQEDQGAHPRVPGRAGARPKKLKGPILCFVGPPGVGKTIARASRSRARRAASSCACRSAACATRPRSAATAARTSARCPARSSRSLKKAGTNNPVFLLDEVDKMSTDFRGDPAAALLEVLDPEQNNDLQRPLPRSRLRPVAT